MSLRSFIVRQGQLWIGLICGVLLTYSLIGMFGKIQKAPDHIPEKRILESSPVVLPVSLPTDELTNDEQNTIEVFQNVAPSVVFITNKALRRDFFSMDVFEIPQGSGSGFIWDNNGNVVTNYHVIAKANAISVTLSDHSSYEAEVVGADPSKDIAVVRIDAPAHKLQPVPVGSSDRLRVGQKVLAIGNPFGLDQTLTVGVVSAIGREIKSVTNRTIQDVIQTDTAINPGNSGGPLLDSHGRLIGVNTAILSPSGAYAGVGFAVPVNTVRRVVPQLIQHGKVVRPGLGVSIIVDNVAEQLGIEGVIIGNVPEGSNADRAGLIGIQRNLLGEPSLGDVIIAVEGTKIRNSDDLANTLEKYRVGDTVSVTVLRDDKERTLSVQLQEIE